VQNEQRSQAAAHFQKGNELARTRHFAEAIAEFIQASELVASTSVLYNLGQCYEELGRDEEALQTFQRVIRELQAMPSLDPAGARRVTAARQRAEVVQARLALNAAAVPPVSPETAAFAPATPPIPLPVAPLVPPDRHAPAPQLTAPSGATTLDKPASFLAQKWWIVAVSTAVVGTATVFLLNRSRDQPAAAAPLCPAKAKLGCL
jgi:tetratricopeptide (TPR) repeat protein